jgi:hypothetical protein
MIDHGTAALGLSTNQVGEIYAIGMVLHRVMHPDNNSDKLTNPPHHRVGDTPINLHIWTDSKTCYGIFTKKWRSKNNLLTDLVRSAIYRFRARKGSKLTFHWCPGHAGVPQNDLADRFANAGSTCSSNNFSYHFDLIRIVQKTGFLNPSEHL